MCETHGGGVECCGRRGWEFPIMATLAVLALVVAIIVLIVAKEEILIIAVLAGIAGLIVIAMVIVGFIRCYRDRPAQRNENSYGYKKYTHTQHSDNTLRSKIPPVLLRTSSTIRHDRRDVVTQKRRVPLVIQQQPSRISRRDNDNDNHSYFAFVRSSNDTGGGSNLVRHNSLPDVTMFNRPTIAPACKCSTPALPACTCSSPAPSYHTTDRTLHRSTFHVSHEPCAAPAPPPVFNVPPIPPQQTTISAQPISTIAPHTHISAQPFTTIAPQPLAIPRAPASTTNYNFYTTSATAAPAAPVTTYQYQQPAQDNLSIISAQNRNSQYSAIGSSAVQRSSHYSTTMPSDLQFTNLQNCEPRYQVSDGQHVTRLTLNRQ